MVNDHLDFPPSRLVFDPGGDPKKAERDSGVIRTAPLECSTPVIEIDSNFASGGCLGRAFVLTPRFAKSGFGGFVDMLSWGYDLLTRVLGSLHSPLLKTINRNDPHA